MIGSLRAFFLSRVLREKLLLLVFLAFGLVWWLSSFAGRAGLAWRDHRATVRTLQDQDNWIRRRPAVEALAQAAASRLVPEKTLDGTRLVGVVNQAAAEAGLRSNQYNSMGVTNDATGQFTIHTLDFQVTGVTATDYAMMLRFYLNLQKHAPYVGIEAFSLTGQNRAGGAHTLRLKISSVEIAR